MARKPADQSVSREDIIMAAADVLRHNGYDATTMKDIAAQVNLTAASLYHHFTNKDTLLLAVLEGGINHALDEIAPVVRSDLSHSEKLRAMVRAHIRGITDNTAVGAAMVFEVRNLMSFKVPSRNASSFGKTTQREFMQRREAFFQARDNFEEYFRKIVRDGIAAGEFREVDVPLFVKTMLGAQNWVGVWYREGGRLDGITIADHIADNFLRALKQ